MPNEKSVGNCLVCAKVINGYPHAYATKKHLPICSGDPCSKNWDALTYTQQLEWLDLSKEKKVVILAMLHAGENPSALFPNPSEEQRLWAVAA